MIKTRLVAYLAGIISVLQEGRQEPSPIAQETAVKIDPASMLYVVGETLTEMSLREFAHAIRGGMNLDTIQVFTEKEEADVALTIQGKRKQLNEITDEELLNARVVRVVGSRHISGSVSGGVLLREIVLTERRAV